MRSDCVRRNVVDRGGGTFCVLAGAGAFTIAVSILAGSVAFGDETEKPSDANTPRPRLTLSREVTFFTEPLAADGLVDYAAALNARYGKGVTPENNAAVVLVNAVGRRDADYEKFASLCKRLGIEPVPEHGQYFVRFDRFVFDLGERYDRDPDAAAKRIGLKRDVLGELLKKPIDFSETLERCQQIPWTGSDEPLLDAWLKHIETPLDQCVSGSERPQFYVPLESGAGIDGLLRPDGISFSVLSIAQALTVRAMRHCAESRLEASWNDILAARRWAHRVAEGGMVIDHMLGMAARRQASAAAIGLLVYGNASRDQIERMARGWREASADMPLVECFETTERTFSLEAMNAVFRGTQAAYPEFSPSVSSKLRALRSHRYPRWVTTAAIDWDAAFRSINVVHDELERISRLATRRARLRALEEMNERADRRGRPINAAAMLLSITTLEFPAQRKAVGQLLGTIVASQLRPVMNSVITVDQQRNTEYGLVPVIFGLTRYRAARGEYPKSLDQLVPAFLEAVPADDFGDGPLKYKRRDDGGFELYSVGVNGRDDGGATAQPLVDTTSIADAEESDDDVMAQEDDPEKPDDLVIRVGAPRK